MVIRERERRTIEKVKKGTKEEIAIV